MGRFLSCLVGWVLVSGAGAQEVAPPARAVGTATATGVLSAVDAAAGTFTLTRANGPIAFRTNADTRVRINDEPGELAALKPETKVRVGYQKQGEAPFVATRVDDAATVAVLDAERAGVGADLVGVETRGEGDAKQTVVVVTTAQGKRRELVVRAAGSEASVVLRDGQPAALDAFRAGERVTVAVRRTSGDTRYLAALADAATFAAFCAQRTLRGQVAEVAADGRSLTVRVEGRPEPVTVRWGRATTFYKGDQAPEANPFVAGDAVVVKYQTTAKGVVAARALFEPGSWRAYAEVALRTP